MRALSMLVPYLALMGLATCAPEPPPGGAALFAQHCVACHGPGGAGDGVLAADLPVPPADLAQIAARNGGTFPMEDVMAAIYGYRGKDEAGLMPAFGPVVESPPVLWRAPDGREIPTPSLLLELAEYVEDLQTP